MPLHKFPNKRMCFPKLLCLNNLGPILRILDTALAVVRPNSVMTEMWPQWDAYCLFAGPLCLQITTRPERENGPFKIKYKECCFKGTVSPVIQPLGFLGKIPRLHTQQTGALIYFFCNFVKYLLWLLITFITAPAKSLEDFSRNLFSLHNFIVIIWYIF